MAKLPQQRGPSTDRFERRYGLNGIGLPEGVNTELPPGSMRKEQFRRLINTRWRGTRIVPRGGQFPLNANPIHDEEACIFPADFVLGSPKRLWSIGAGCPGVNGTTGFTLAHFDPEQSPQFQRAVWFATAVDQIAVGSYGGVPHVGIDSDFRRVQLVRVPWGTENMALSGSDQTVPIDTFAGYVTNAMLEVGGIFYLALDDGAGNGKIMSWDGKTIRTDLTGINAPTALGKWRDQLVVGFGSGTNHIRIRAQGSTSPGSYTTVSPGAGTVAAVPGLNSIVSFRDSVWIVDGDVTVWKYNGSTLTAAHVITDCDHVTSIAVAFNDLFVGFTDTSDHAVLAATPDGTAWNDNYKDFNDLEETQAYDLSGLAYYKDCLAVGVRSHARTKVYLSPGPSTAGTYIGYVPNDLTGGPDPDDIRYLVPI